MNATVRKKSPRAPSSSLSEALDRALRVYGKERLHAAPTEVFAQNMGYKSANSGSALQMIASLRYFGLAERVSDGVLAISKDVESLKFAPSESLKADILKKFLRAPALYGELLDKYTSALPSDPNLRFELIQRGFAPAAAESVLVAFRQSVEFAGYYAPGQRDEAEITPEPDESNSTESPYTPMGATFITSAPHTMPPPAAGRLEDFAGSEDRIPVRLPGGRRAWLVIPSPFFEADKTRLKAQIDLLLTSDEEDGRDEI
ncbi:hypothetical protein [Stenotrophomonas sp. 364]|uniref:hypothetical protein n=1 Tax=Stenotrophomonas sp. 364 TaxID=2691571 RepID=UPI0013183BB5|nr:hypothetical protein [Stenotrophomonas sp. 364]QHB73132.1 hypothetical protein GQ674_18355 [Stenotrophomonas sp. 364]